MEQHYLVPGRIITLLISCPSQRSLFATQCTLTALGRNHFSSAHSACAVLRRSMWSRIQTVAPKRGQQWGLLGRKLVWLCADASLEREIETFFHFSKIARKWLTSWLSLVYLGMAPYFLTSLPRGAGDTHVAILARARVFYLIPLTLRKLRDYAFFF